MSASTTHPTAPSPAEIWSAGNYADVCERMIPDLGARLVESAGITPGHLVLDVAAGTGNAALPAARAGARVTALDITPDLLERGAERASAEDLQVQWVQGDAHALPFPEATFDRVLSCVGVQFCADHAAAAAELVRVCRPRGRVGLTCWTPEGFIGRVLAAVAQAAGGGARPSPLAWGSEETLTGLFGDRADRVALRREQIEMTAGSPLAWVDYMAGAYGPLVRARERLEPESRWEPLRAQLGEIAAAHDAGGGERFAAQAEYLVAVLQRAG